MAMKREAGDLAMAVLVLGVGGLALFGASRHAYYTEFGPDAGFFPFWVGLAETLLGLALIGHALQNRKQPKEELNSSRWRQFAVGGLLIGYLLLMQAFGFIIATAVFLFAVMTAVERRSWRGAMLVGVGLTGALFGLFGWAFSIPLPQGIFGDL